MPRLSLLPRDQTFFDFFVEAGDNAVQIARLLDRLIADWPDRGELPAEILEVEHEGDRITHEIIKRLNSTFVTPLDREDIYALATKLDDVVDFAEEAADLLVIYKIEAPMSQAGLLSRVLVEACRELAEALKKLPTFKDLDRHWIEIHRLENEADRI